MLLDRLSFILNRIREEWPRELHEIGQFLRPRTKQIEQPVEPGVGYSHLETRLLKERRDGMRQAIRCEARDVLAVHPVELVRVEDRVAAADTLERKSADELIHGHQLAIVPGRPAEEC